MTGSINLVITESNNKDRESVCVCVSGTERKGDKEETRSFLLRDSV